MDAVKMVHKNGTERVVTTPAERVAAEFDGFALTPASKAAETRRASKPASKRAAKKAASTTTRGEKGPAAKTAASSTTTTSSAPAGTASATPA